MAIFEYSYIMTHFLLESLIYAWELCGLISLALTKHTPKLMLGDLLLLWPGLHLSALWQT